MLPSDRTWPVHSQANCSYGHPQKDPVNTPAWLGEAHEAPPIAEELLATDGCWVSVGVATGGCSYPSGWSTPRNWFQGVTENKKEDMKVVEGEGVGLWLYIYEVK